MSDTSRRKLLKSIAAGSGAVIAGKSLPESWSRPIVDSVMLPAHAQLSSCASYIRVTSPTSNSGLRMIGIVDSSDNVLARCCCGGSADIVIEAGSLAAGTYYVFGDSEGPMSHAIEITTGPACAVTNVTAPTDENQLRHLMATITLPAGTVTPESGQLVGVDKSGPAINCVSGEDGGP